MRLIFCFILVFAALLRAEAQQNLNFEDVGESGAAKPAYWFTGGDGSYVLVDSTTCWKGSRSLRMSLVKPGTFAIARQTFSADSLVGSDLVFSGWIRTLNVADGYAGLWLRLDGVYQQLYLENMSNRGVTGTTPWGQYEIKTSISTDVHQIAFGALLTGTGTAWFDSFELNPSSTPNLRMPSSEALSYLNHALDIMQTNSIRRDSIDWKSFRSSIITRVRGAVKTSDTYPQIRYALALLADHHSFLMPPDVAKVHDRGKDSLDANSQVRSQIIESRFGYISVPGFSSSNDSSIRAFAFQIQYSIIALDSINPCGWIVDLRNNQGGNMWPMLLGLGPIIGDDTLGEFVFPLTIHHSWWYKHGAVGTDSTVYSSITIPPYELHRKHPFVAVLTGNTTASSGEALTISFRNRPHTRSFGTATFGLSSSNEPYLLSDGAMIALTTSILADRTGRVFGGKIQPDEIIQATPVTDVAKDSIVQAALNWLRTQNSCNAN